MAITLEVIGGSLTVVAKEAGAVFVTVGYEGLSITAKGDQMSYTLPVGKQVSLQVKYVDAGGNPAAVDGAVDWESSDPAIAAITVDAADTTKATVITQGVVGQAQVRAIADADLGSGVRELITTMDVSVVAGEAVAGTISPVGEATDIPPA